MAPIGPSKPLAPNVATEPEEIEFVEAAPGAADQVRNVESIEKLRQVQLVGNKIRQLRKERKLTQVELSQRLGIQQSDLSRMEQGEYRVSLDTLFRVLAEFRLSIGEFFENLGQQPVTHRGDQLLHEFNALSQDAQREVEDFIAWKRSQARSSAASANPPAGPAEGSAIGSSAEAVLRDAQGSRGEPGAPPARNERQRAKVRL